MTVMLLQNNAAPANNYNNNNNNSSGKQDGPSTIEEQYKKIQVNINLRLSSPRLNLFAQPGGAPTKGRAMNYYRLWIYTCNTVLLLSVLAFVIVAAKLVIIDPRRSLIPGLSLYHPSLMYSYLALLAQCGLLQLVGCLGAIRLNERLLNTYWLLILILLCGDAIIGLVWIFKFDKIYTELKPILKHRLQYDYGQDAYFTYLWDNIQNDFECCGVEGPQDFNTVDLKKLEENNINRVERYNMDTTTMNALKEIETSYETPLLYDYNSTTEDGTTYTDWVTIIPTETNIQYVKNVPETCCRILKEKNKEDEDNEEDEDLEKKPMLIQRKSRTKRELFRHRDSNCEEFTNNKYLYNKCKKNKRHINNLKHSYYRNTHIFPQNNYNILNETRIPIEKTKELRFSTGNVNIMNTCARINGYTVGTVYGMTETLHYSVGCEIRLKKWLSDSAHVLGVLGYCVVAFFKLCFLGILRYEIREMIQKIKIIKGECQPPILLLSNDSPNGSMSPTSPKLCNHLENKIVDGGRIGSTGNALLLLQPSESSQTTPVHHIKTIQMTQNTRLLSSIIHNDTGNESDTNSHSALLIDRIDRDDYYRKNTRMSSNGNNNYEQHELQELLMANTAQI